jgi:CheY-like chemotaxis protein
LSKPRQDAREGLRRALYFEAVRAIDHHQATQRVLVVDDNQGDFILLREAFRSAAPEIVLDHAASASAALRCIEQAPIPDLVLIDLGLQGLDGKALLKHVRRGRRRIPAVVLTGSTRKLDREECLRLGAAHYAVKPSFFGGYLALADSIARYLRHRSTGSSDDAPTPSIGSVIVNA